MTVTLTRCRRCGERFHRDTDDVPLCFVCLAIFEALAVAKKAKKALDR